MILKKHISFLLAFFLLVTNSGLAFNIHYCGNEIAAVSIKTTFISTASEKSCCGINEAKSHCCKDKVIHIEKKSDNVILKAFAFNAYSFVLIDQYKSIVFSPFQNFKNHTAATYFCEAHAPPLFKQYHQYIFYA